MATKKQKRERGVAKQRQEAVELQRTNTLVLRKEQERRLKEELKEWEDNHSKNHSSNKLVIECPHCRIEMRATKQQNSGQLNPAIS